MGGVMDDLDSGNDVKHSDQIAPRRNFQKQASAEGQGAGWMNALARGSRGLVASTITTAALLGGVGAEEAFAQNKPNQMQNKPQNLPTTLMTIKPQILPTKGPLETDQAHAVRCLPFQQTYQKAHTEYIKKAYAALENHQPYPLLQQFVPKYGRMLMPIGDRVPLEPNPITTMPRIVMSENVSDNTIEGVMFEKYLLLTISVNKDGKMVTPVDMAGCKYRLAIGGKVDLNADWQEFPADAAGQAAAVQAASHKGDKIEIAIPQKMVVDAALQKNLIDTYFKQQGQSY